MEDKYSLKDLLEDIENVTKPKTPIDMDKIIAVSKKQVEALNRCVKCYPPTELYQEARLSILKNGYTFTEIYCKVHFAEMYPKAKVP